MTQAMFPYVVVFLSIVTFTKSMKQLVLLIHLWLFSHVYQAIYGITHGGHGIGGYFGDENDLGVTLVMAIPVAYFLFLGSQRIKRLMYMICLVILIIGSVISFSRGGFIGLVAISAYCLWKSPKRLAGIATMALLVIVMLTFAPTGYWEEMNSIKSGTEDLTAEHRVYLWKIAWRMFLDNPLMGVGPESFTFAVSLYEPPGGFYSQYQGMRALHSAPFQLLSGLALPGLIIYTLLIYKHFQSVQHISQSKSSSSTIQRTPLPTEQAVQAGFLRATAVGFGGGLIGFMGAGGFCERALLSSILGYDRNNGSNSSNMEPEC